MAKESRRKAARATPGCARSAAPGPSSPAPPPALSAQGFWLAPFAVFAGLLALYLATLAPSVTGGDSGELVTASLTGGVPHPPGYPLFAMLARGIAALPLGPSPVWRVNLLSALTTAAAAGLLCALVRLWTGGLVGALVAAVLFGTNPVVWYHATAAEVFGLNACFVALALLLWLLVERTGARRYVFALALLSGLAMSNQHTFVLAGLPLVARTVWVTRARLRPLGIGLVGAFGVLGLGPYLYLPIAAGATAAVSWGDQTTFSGLVAHVLRLSYGPLGLGRARASGAFADQGTFLPTLWALLGHAVPRLAWIGLPLACAGFCLSARTQREPNETVVLGIALAAYVLVFCAFSTMSPRAELFMTEVSRFFIQSDLLLAAAAGLGCAELLSLLAARWPALPRLAFVLPALVLVAGLGLNARAGSRRNDLVLADFATTVLTSLPPDAIVVTYGDHVSGAIAYFHEVEQLRPDVVHLDREMLSYPWYGQRKQRRHRDFALPPGGYGQSGYDVARLLASNPTRPLVVVDRLPAWDESWTKTHKLVPRGLVHLIVANDAVPSFADWAAADARTSAGYDVVPALRFPKGTWENAIGQLVLTTQAMRAHRALVYSLDADRNPARARLALRLLEDLIAKAGGDAELGIAGVPGVPELAIGPTAWRDLGLCYEILARENPAYPGRVRVAVQRFVAHALPDNPELPAAKKYLELQATSRGQR